MRSSWDACPCTDPTAWRTLSHIHITLESLYSMCDHNGFVLGIDRIVKKILILSYGRPLSYGRVKGMTPGSHCCLLRHFLLISYSDRELVEYSADGLCRYLKCSSLNRMFVVDGRCCCLSRGDPCSVVGDKSSYLFILCLILYHS